MRYRPPPSSTGKVPRRLSAILEGESLLNDASGLIIFRYALIAVDTGRFVFHEAALSFVVVIVMGILTGIAIGMLFFAAHKWLPVSVSVDIVLSLITPYVMYIVAESFHFSGVLSVVSGGLFLSARNHLFLNYRSRLRGLNVWTTLGFVLNGLIFLLIGLELPSIIHQLGPVGLSFSHKIWGPDNGPPDRRQDPQYAGGLCLYGVYKPVHHDSRQPPRLEGASRPRLGGHEGSGVAGSRTVHTDAPVRWQPLSPAGPHLVHYLCGDSPLSPCTGPIPALADPEVKAGGSR